VYQLAIEDNREIFGCRR